MSKPTEVVELPEQIFLSPTAIKSMLGYLLDGARPGRVQYARIREATPIAEDAAKLTGLVAQVQRMLEREAYHYCADCHTHCRQLILTVEGFKEAARQLTAGAAAPADHPPVSDEEMLDSISVIPAPVDGWLPIASAPMEITHKSGSYEYGRTVLLYDGNIITGCWWQCRKKGGEIYGSNWIDSGANALRPTHFQLLPPAPKQEAEVDDQS